MFPGLTWDTAQTMLSWGGGVGGGRLDHCLLLLFVPGELEK